MHNPFHYELFSSSEKPSCVEILEALCEEKTWKMKSCINGEYSNHENLSNQMD